MKLFFKWDPSFWNWSWWICRFYGKRRCTKSAISVTYSPDMVSSPIFRVVLLEYPADGSKSLLQYSVIVYQYSWL